MEVKARQKKAWKQIVLVMALAGAAITGSVVAPAFQPHGVQVTYADGCDGGGVNPPYIDCDPTPTNTPTATPTPDPDHP